MLFEKGNKPTKSLHLGISVKDLDKVASEDKWKQNGALGLVLKGNGVQAIYGPKADILKSNIQDIIGV